MQLLNIIVTYCGVKQGNITATATTHDKYEVKDTSNKSNNNKVPNEHQVIHKISASRLLLLTPLCAS